MSTVVRGVDCGEPQLVSAWSGWTRPDIGRSFQMGKEEELSSTQNFLQEKCIYLGNQESSKDLSLYRTSSLNDKP